MSGRARTIRSAGDHEEFIAREHTAYIAASIAGAGLMILPSVSHFVPMRAPALFNAVVLQFLDGSGQVSTALPSHSSPGPNEAG